MHNHDREPFILQLSATLQKQLTTLTRERQAAVEKMEALGANTDAKTQQTLLEYMTQNENVLLRPLAASRLGEIGDPAMVDVLIELVTNSDDVEIRILAVQVLGDIGHDTTVVALANALQDDALLPGLMPGSRDSN